MKYEKCMPQPNEMQNNKTTTIRELSLMSLIPGKWKMQVRAR